jgi:aminoglycoside phosphotransferase family enzyme/predicted kinase
MTPLGSILDWLARPESFPERPSNVELIQTDETVVALAGEKAYKLCLPVKSDDRDLSTPALREKSLQRELRLNRRLGGDIYLDVCPIYSTGEDWSFDESGSPVDFLLRMKRLPADRMLRSAMSTGGLGEEDLDSLGDLLAEFYSSAKPVARSLKGKSTEGLQIAIHQAVAAVAEVSDCRDELALIEPALLIYLARHQDVFEKRATQGRTRECHGDLRIDHLCMVRPPIVIGSVDSKDRPRQIDVLSDLAVLLVDTEFAGHGDIGWRVWERLAGRLNEPVDQPLLFFYRAYRAFMLSRREAMRLEPKQAAIARWLEIAAHHSRAIHQPRLFVTVGLMGTGKTTLSEAMESDLGVTRLSSEEMSKELYPPGTDGKSNANRMNPEHRDRIYGELLVRIERALSKGISIVVDGTYLHRRHREGVMELASKMGIVPMFLECRLAKSETIARLDRRYKKNRIRPGSRPELLEEQSLIYEPPDEIPSENVLVLNMNQPVPRLVEIVRESL